MRWLITVPCAVLLWAPLPAQTPDQVVLDEKARRMRVQLDDGSTIRTHVRVDLRLRNGNRLQGVVKDSHVVEQRNGALRFSTLMNKSPESTLQLWYSNRNNSFVILPFVDVLEYRINERLTTIQLQAIEQELIARQKELDQIKQQQEAARQAEAAQQGTGETTEGGDTVQPPSPPAPGTGAGAQTKGKSEAKEPQPRDDADLLLLLQEFPPADGWGAERKAEILRRKVAIGAAPAANEKRFMEVFDDWQKAVTKFVGGPKPPAEDAGKTGRQKR
jgi:hypothetical protein